MQAHLAWDFLTYQSQYDRYNKVGMLKNSSMVGQIIRRLSPGGLPLVSDHLNPLTHLSSSDGAGLAFEGLFFPTTIGQDRFDSRRLHSRTLGI